LSESLAGRKKGFGTFTRVIRFTVFELACEVEAMAQSQETMHYRTPAFLFGAVIIAMVVLGFVLLRGEPRTTDANPIPATSGQIGSPNQVSPQGPTGPLTTGSGGAPASKPEGDTPPDMQAKPKEQSNK
jgi:hypothetical protein